MKPEMLPDDAIKHAVSTLSDDDKIKQEFVGKLERIFDQYPERADELLAIARDEITKSTLPKPVRSEIHNLVQRTKVLSIKNASKQENSSPDSSGSYGSWNNFLKSDHGTPAQLSPGKIIRNTYRLETLLGIGGMGEVWKATHLIQDAAETAPRDRFVAIKFLNIDFKNHPDALKTLAREFAYSRKLIHENIVQVFELNHSDNLVFIAMEFLSGSPLDRWINDHPNGIPLKDAAPIIRGICDALKFAHMHEFIHLDVKPSNIFYDPNTGMVKVIDFGIARHASPIDRAKTRFDVGDLNAVTEAYASLEMLHCIDPDPSDDIYGLACVTYELLTGRHPYDKRPANIALSKNLRPDVVAGLNSSQNSTLVRGLDLLRKQRTSNVEQFQTGLLPKQDSLQNYWNSPVRVAVSALLIVGAIWLVPKVIGSLLDMQYGPIRQGILAEKSESATALFQSPDDEQEKILTEKEVISALVNIYTKNIDDDAIKEFTALADPLRKQIYEDTDIKKKLMEHYKRSIDEHASRDAYPQAEQLLSSIRGIYPDSQQLSQIKRTTEIEKNRRLTALVQQFQSCFPVHQESPLRLSDCLVSNWTKVVKIEPDNPMSLGKVDEWFRKSLRTSLNRKKGNLGAHLLANWEIIQSKDSQARSVLRDALNFGNARISSLPKLWAEFARTDADRRSKILDIKLAQEKLLVYAADSAFLMAKENNYPGAFKSLNDAIEVTKNHPDSFSKLQIKLKSLEQEYQAKMGRLTGDYQTKIKNCDPDQLKVRDTIRQIGGTPLNGNTINQNCIASVRGAIVAGDPAEVSKQFDNWKKLSVKSPPEFDALTIAKQVRFHEGELPAHIRSLAALPTDQQQLVLNIERVQERLVNHYRGTVEQKVTGTGFPSALRFIDEMVGKISSHEATLKALGELRAETQKKQKRKIVSLLFEYQREVPKCGISIGLLQTKLDEVGSDRSRFQGLDESCYRKMQGLLAKEEITNAEGTLKIWRQLRPDDETTYLQQRNLVSDKLVDMKAQFKEIQILSDKLKQGLRNNDDNQVSEIITTQISNLSSWGLDRFWVNNETDLSNYFIAKAKEDLGREDFDEAQVHCERGLSIYAQSSTLLTDCKNRVDNQRQQKISGLTKDFEDYLKKGWLVDSIRYPDGVLGLLDEISHFDKNNSLLKSVGVHSAFKDALLDAVKKMQLEQARTLNGRWAKIFEREYASDDAVGIRDSANNRSATQALMIARGLIREGFKDRAKEFLQLGLELGPIASVTKQIESELTNINAVP